jgi:hypothetical protein
MIINLTRAMEIVKIAKGKPVFKNPGMSWDIFWSRPCQGRDEVSSPASGRAEGRGLMVGGRKDP